MKQQHWWHDYPWRMVLTNLREIDMLDISAADFVQQLKKFHASLVMINTGGILASYETQLPYHFQSPYLKGDSLRKIMDACHDAGVRVIARTDFSKIRRAIYEVHPEWAYRTVEGEIVDYEGDVHACICGRFQQDYAFQILREILETLPVDGVVLDLPMKERVLSAASLVTGRSVQYAQSGDRIQLDVDRVEEFESIKLLLANH